MKEKYLNFPIQLLEGFMLNDKQVLSNIMTYAVYEHSLKLTLGTELENMKASASYCSISLGNVKQSLIDGKKLYNTIPQKPPKVGLNLSILSNFLNNDKSEFDKICLLAFLGIKSILGTKTYCKMGNNFWLARMDGKSKTINDITDLSKEIRKYSTEHQTKKIKTELRNNWGLITYSRYCRGFYVSFKITLEGLIMEAEKRKKSNKEKQYKEQEKELIKKVLEKLKDNTTITRPITF